MSNSEIQGTSERQVLETGLPLIFQLNPGQNVRISFLNLAKLGIQFFHLQGSDRELG